MNTKHLMVLRVGLGIPWVSAAQQPKADGTTPSISKPWRVSIWARANLLPPSRSATAPAPDGRAYCTVGVLYCGVGLTRRFESHP